MTIALLFLIAGLLVPGQQGGAAAAPQGPVAIVASASGDVWLIEQGQRRRVTDHEWLSAGAVVDVGPRASARVIMIDGQRYELGPGSSIEFAPGGVTTVRGPVEKGAALPPIPVAPIAGLVPRQSAAVRIRGQRIPGLNPCPAIRTIADATTLRFDAVADATAYEIAILRNAAPLFSRRTTGTVVNVPPGVLAAGSEYAWTVNTIGGPVVAEGTATFGTLDERTNESRRAIIEALKNDGEPGLIAAINARLGLLNEAVGILTEALERNPTDSVRASLQRARDALAAACK